MSVILIYITGYLILRFLLLNRIPQFLADRLVKVNKFRFPASFKASYNKIWRKHGPGIACRKCCFVITRFIFVNAWQSIARRSPALSRNLYGTSLISSFKAEKSTLFPKENIDLSRPISILLNHTDSLLGIVYSWIQFLAMSNPPIKSQ